MVVSTLSMAKRGSRLVAARPTPLTLVRLGIPAAVEPWSSAAARLEDVKPLSVLTTCTSTKPSPRGVVGGTCTSREVGVCADGASGHALIGPAAVATKKLTIEPLVKFLPVILKAAPTRMVGGTLPIEGSLETGVGDGFAVGLGVWVAVGRGVAVGGAVGIGVGF